MPNSFFHWLAVKINAAQDDGTTPDREPDSFYDKTPRREYVFIQKTPTGSFVEHTFWDGGTPGRHNANGSWVTEARMVPAGESVEAAITLLRVQAALKCQN